MTRFREAGNEDGSIVWERLRDVVLTRLVDPAL